LIIPDGRIGWYYGAIKAGKKIINDNNIDMIFTSGPPHSVHLIGNSLAKKTGIKWVTDFRDPWVDSFYYIENPRNKVISFFDNYLEKLVLRNCNYLITVSNGVLSLLNQNKYVNGKSEVIYNGYDPEDFNNKKIKKLLNRKNIIISHIGTLSKSQNPKGLFNSVKNFNRLNNRKSILVKCIGNVHSSIEDYAIKNDLKQYLSILPYVEHPLAINEMINSDILFVVIPDLEKNRGIITGKLFEYIASGTEIILIGKKNSEASRILMDLGYQHVYGINDEIDFNSLLISNHKSQSSVHKINRIEQSKQLSQIFNMLSEESPNEM
jgi:glycosyltransferase involved in cell wall biosynthesis